MNNIFNRLQFVRHEEVFATREEAYSYVIDNQVVNRATLVGEPMVLLYENEDASKGPNVILAIGSVGDGTQNVNNKTYFIDTQKTEEELIALDKKLEDAIKCLTIIPIESDTLNLHKENTTDGVVLSGDVKVADYKIIDGIVRNNIITTTENGLFTFIDLDYDAETSILKFNVNGTVKDIELPKNRHVVSGEYDIATESIVLTLADNSKVTIPVTKLIEEWTVLPDGIQLEGGYTPITLSKVHVGANETEHEGIYDYQDVLEADVRVADHIGDNILHKDKTGRFLYVKGTADNIKYTEGVTVKDAIDSIDTKISTNTGNLIYKRADGIFAAAKLDYNAATNVLTFNYSDGNSGEMKQTEIKLNSARLVDSIEYNPVTETIDIRWQDADGNFQKVSIDVKNLITEWDINNESHSVSLIKSRHNVTGLDILSADAKIYDGDNNILEEKNHELYVNGIADNIKYDVTGDTTVKGEIDDIKDVAENTNIKLDKEINDRKTADENLKTQINTIATDLSNETTARKEADEALNQRVTTNENDIATLKQGLNDEINARKEADEALDGKIKTINDTIYNEENGEPIFSTDKHETVTYKFNELNGKLDTEITRAEGKETELDNKITAEVERASAAETALDEKIDAEITRAEGKETELNNKITAEVERASAAETALDEKIDAEVERASAAETALDSKFSGILGSGFTSTDERDTVTAKVNELRDSINSVSGAVDTKLAINDFNSYSADTKNTIDTINNELAKKVVAVSAEDKSINVDATDITNPLIKVNISKVKDEVKVDGKDNSRKNIITLESDGIHADVDLTYNTVTNTLTFTKTGDATGKDIKLVSNSIVNDIYYDTTKEVIVVKYTVNGVEQTPVEVNVKDLITEWDVTNNSGDGSIYDGTILLSKARNKIPTTNASGDSRVVDALSAKAIISLENDNILTKKTDGLYVSGAKINELDSNLNELSGKTTDLITKVDEEIERSTDTDRKLETTIGSGFTTDKSETITAKFNELTKNVADLTAQNTAQDADIKEISGNVKTLTDNLNTVSGTADSALAKANANEAKIETINSDITAITDKVNDRVQTVKNDDKSIVVTTTTDEANGNKIVDVKLGISKEKPNIIKTYLDGVYADVNLTYDSTSNKLIFSKSGAEDVEIPLINASMITDVKYDNKNELIVITYTINGREQTINVPVRDLINEWTTKNTKSIVLTKTINNTTDADGRAYDTLTADVVINPKEDNVIELTEDGLYVHKSIESINGSTSINVNSVDDRYNPSMSVKLSNSESNIIRDTENGLLAEVNFNYDKNENIITFNDGKTTYSYALKAIQDVKSVIYDKTTETFKVTLDKGSTDEILTIDVKDLVNEWTVSTDTGGSIELGKVRNVDGTDLLTARVLINDSDDNILVRKGSSLYVSGKQISENTNEINKLKGAFENTSGNTNTTLQELTNRVQEISTGLTSEIDRATSAEGTLSDRITAEQKRATDEEKRIDAKLDSAKDAISKNASDITGEIERAKGAESGLTRDIAIETTRATAAEAANTKAITDETNRATAAEAANTKAIEDEVTRATTAEGVLDGKITEANNAINTEIGRAKNAENGLKTDITDEITRATTAESGLASDIATETTRATNAEALNAANISNEVNRAKTAENELDKGLKKEIANREECCRLNSQAIDTERTRATAKEDEIDDAVKGEITRATAAEGQLSTKIEGLSGHVEGINTTLIEKINTETVRATGAEAANTKAITDETNRAKEEESKLQTSITGEIERAKNKESELETEIENQTLTFVNTDTVGITRTLDNKVSADVKISNLSENIIASTNDSNGIFASVKLSYDTATNTIKLVTNKGEQAGIKLNAGSLLDKVEYDSVNKQLVFTYHDADNIEHTTEVPVAELFNDWEVNNPIADSAIKLTKTVGTSGQSDTLSAEVLISTKDDNIIKIDNNSLYVSNSAITNVTQVADCTNNELKALENAVLGKEITNCGEGYTYTSPDGVNYITTAKSISSAAFLLDKAIKDVDNKVEAIKEGNKTTSERINCIKNKLDVTTAKVLGVDLSDCGRNAKGENYTYRPNSLASYINTATSFYNADELLDQAISNVSKQVSGSTTAITEVNKTIEALDKKVDTVINGTGLQSDGKYTTPGGCIISAATSLYNADILLNDAICSLTNDLDTLLVGSDSPSVHMENKTVGKNNVLVSDVRLSHGNGNGVTDDELVIGDFKGDEIENGVYEFTDTNIIQIVNIKTIDNDGVTVEVPTDIGYNGLYLSNVWTCGEYTEGGVGTPGNKYMVDTSASSSNINYGNSVRMNDVIIDESEDTNVDENNDTATTEQ